MTHGIVTEDVREAFSNTTRACPTAGISISAIITMAHRIMAADQNIDVMAAMARVKSWQKFGLWDAHHLGKGKKGLYGREAVQRAALIAELGNFGVGPAIGSRLAYANYERVFVDGVADRMTTIGIAGSRSSFMIDSPALFAHVEAAMGAAHGNV